MTTNAYQYCPHCGDKLTKEELENATGACHEDSCQEKQGNI